MRAVCLLSAWAAASWAACLIESWSLVVLKSSWIPSWLLRRQRSQKPAQPRMRWFSLFREGPRLSGGPWSNLQPSIAYLAHVLTVGKLPECRRSRTTSQCPSLSRSFELSGFAWTLGLVELLLLRYHSAIPV